MAELAARLLAQKEKGKKNLCKKSNVLIQCQASGLRSSPQTFINPPRAIKGGIRGPKETKSWWIELISPPMMDGPVHRGLQNRSIVHLSLRLPCPSMICTLVVKATSGPKTSLSSPSSSTSLCVSPLPRNSHSRSLLKASTPTDPSLMQPDAQNHQTSQNNQPSHLQARAAVQPHRASWTLWNESCWWVLLRKQKNTFCFLKYLMW